MLDEWSYPRHHRGVTEHPGLYAVGLPRLTGHGSSIVAGVGRDAGYMAQHIAGNIVRRNWANDVKVDYKNPAAMVGPMAIRSPSPIPHLDPIDVREVPIPRFDAETERRIG